MIDRRALLRHGAGALLAGGFASRIAFAAAPTERRFVFVIQRGAADGLGIVAPIGDPAYAALRGALADDVAGGAKLDAMFTLHPAMTNLAALYRGGEALFVHAVASPYRSRSHFDGQNVLESGGTRAYQLKDGWMNRMLSLLPPRDAEAIAVSATIPLALRGPHEVTSFAPSALPDASDDLLARVSGLYQGDPQLHALWSEAIETRKLTAGLDDASGRDGAAAGQLAAQLLAPADGARIAMVETGGWDSHSGQTRRLAARLKSLDLMIASLRQELGPLWRNTVVLVATEFGRTAAANGTGGTDHGTASAAMLVGGVVKGGRVVADWPGLAAANLFEARDLRPTMALDTLIAGAVAGHYGVAPDRAMAALFPQAGDRRAAEGLIRA